MLKPDWSVQNEIVKRAEKESWDKWWNDLEPAKLIELKKVEVKRNVVGWLNFLLSELRP